MIFGKLKRKRISIEGLQCKAALLWSSEGDSGTLLIFQQIRAKKFWLLNRERKGREGVQKIRKEKKNSRRIEPRPGFGGRQVLSPLCHPCVTDDILGHEKVVVGRINEEF